MANYAVLKAAINAVIKTNGNKEITGQVLNQTLMAIVDSLGENYQFAGVAVPSTNPGTPDQNIFYLATQAGTYTNFGAIVLPAGISMLEWKNNTWSSETFFTIDDAPTAGSDHLVKSGGVKTAIDNVAFSTNEKVKDVGIDSTPTSGSDNLIKSGAVFDAFKNDGGAYDVSVHFPTGGVEGGNTYTLDGAIAMVPQNMKKGGMSIKFVSSSDNKYVQYRCVAQNFTTDVTQWQGVDDEPTANSKNLVTSGGVDAAIKYTLPKDTDEDGLYICDKDGKVLIRLDKLDTKGGFGENLIADINNLIEAALAELPEPVIKEVIEDGFYICNEDGEAIAKFIDDKWEFLGLDATVTYESGVATKRGNMSNGTEWVISNNAIKHDKRLLFSGKITSFDSLTIGHGKITGNEANWIVITDTNIIEHFVNSGGSEYTGYPKTTPHGLTIENNIQVEIVQAEQAKANVTIVSSGHSFSLNNITWFGSCGDVYASTTSTLTNCSLGWTCSKIKSGIWLFGDSYFSLSDSARWTSYLFTNGYSNFMLNAYPGEDSTRALNNLNKLLEIDTPKEIVWCMGMNDPDSSNAVNSTWKSKLDDVIAICEEKRIELILATIPTVAGGYNPDTQSYNVGIQKYKNAIVRTSGYRYIDFDSAVGANETTGTWFNNGQADDMLEGYGQQRGRIHPTSYGALALYHQAIADCPELTR